MSSRSILSVSRLLYGVSAGVTLGLLYLFYKKMQKKRRQQKDGEVNKSLPVAARRPNTPLAAVKADPSVNQSKSPSSRAKSPSSVTASDAVPPTEAPEVNEEILVTKIVDTSLAPPLPAAIEPNISQTSGGFEVDLEESDFDRDSIIREMKISRDHVPGLIGKKGYNIKNIQHKSNTRINFKEETLENGDRVCLIRGTPQDVTVGESLIEKFLLEQPLCFTQTMSVPVSSIGRIIGRGGETIRAIQDQSKARINADPRLDETQYGESDSVRNRLISIKGTEEQIEMARLLILEKIDDEKTMRKRIDMAASARTPRRSANNSNPSSLASGSSGNSSPNVASTPFSSLSNNGVLEVFVSCVYHPNNFWIQVLGRDSIELDKLCDAMTDWYMRENKKEELSESDVFVVGDLVAAPFDVDDKMYRGKITQINVEENEVQIIYLDYGDMRLLKVSELRPLHSEYLKLRFQAIEASLNLECTDEKWSDDVINQFCDLTYCAQWHGLTGKVKDYLKDPTDNRDVIWMELLDKDLNIGEELIRRGMAKPREIGTPSTTGLRKTYAAAASSEISQSNSDELPSESQADSHQNGNQIGN